MVVASVVSFCKGWAGSIVTTTVAAVLGTIDDPEDAEVSMRPIGVDALDDPGVVGVSSSLDDPEVVEVSPMPVGVGSINDPGVVVVSRWCRKRAPCVPRSLLACRASCGC